MKTYRMRQYQRFRKVGLRSLVLWSHDQSVMSGHFTGRGFEASWIALQTWCVSKRLFSDLARYNIERLNFNCI